jgi:hypothetical protein
VPSLLLHYMNIILHPQDIYRVLADPSTNCLHENDKIALMAGVGCAPGVRGWICTVATCHTVMMSLHHSLIYLTLFKGEMVGYFLSVDLTVRRGAHG